MAPLDIFHRPPDPRAPRPADGLKARFVFAVSIAYGLLILAVWFLARYEGEKWWIATLLLFGPRWVIALPLVPLIAAAAVYHRRSLWILGIDVALTLFPLLGFCLPWKALSAPPSSGPVVRILTCNIHHSASSVARLAKLIADTHPDIVALQEFSPKFKDDVFPPAGSWNVQIKGELCLASKYPITYFHMLPDMHRAAYALALPGGEIDYYNVHLASPHYPLSNAVHGETGGADEVEANSSRRLTEAQDLASRAKRSGSDVLLSGDFNLPSDSAIYRGTIGTLDDAFATAGFGFGWTYHTRWTMVRIDHILSGPDWQCTACWIGPNIGSPHRPLIADLQRIRPGAPATQP